jgi:hypothetical protein
MLAPGERISVAVAREMEPVVTTMGTRLNRGCALAQMGSARIAQVQVEQDQLRHRRTRAVRVFAVASKVALSRRDIGDNFQGWRPGRVSDRPLKKKTVIGVIIDEENGSRVGHVLRSSGFAPCSGVAVQCNNGEARACKNMYAAIVHVRAAEATGVYAIGVFWFDRRIRDKRAGCKEWVRTSDGCCAAFATS